MYRAGGLIDTLWRLKTVPPAAFQLGPIAFTL